MPSGVWSFSVVSVGVFRSVMDTVTDRLISCSTYSADLSTEQTQALEMRGGLSFREHLNSVSPYIPAMFSSIA